MQGALAVTGKLRKEVMDLKQQVNKLEEENRILRGIITKNITSPSSKEETSSDEDEVPLPQPGDMHVEFKKLSLHDRAKKPKIEFIPFRLLQENKQELCKKILSLEQEIDDLRDQNSVLKRKLRKEPTSSTTPPSPPTKKN